MNIIITVSDQVEKELIRDGPESIQTVQLLKTLEENSAEIRPIHSGSGNEGRSVYFLIKVDAAQPVLVFLSQLNALDAVTSAYIKPTDERPL